MLSDKQIRMLELLDNQISDCMECSLYSGGKALPYWTPMSRILMIGEAPGAKEVGVGPFVGPAGKHLWEVVEQHGMRREQFAIINTVQCRPVVPGTNRNGKPTEDQQHKCYSWVRKFAMVIRPYKGILLGNHPCGSILGRPSGITYRNGNTATVRFKHVVTMMVQSVHPSVCIYNGDKGKEMLSKSIRKLKNLE